MAWITLHVPLGTKGVTHGLWYNLCGNQARCHHIDGNVILLCQISI